MEFFLIALLVGTCVYGCLTALSKKQGDTVLVFSTPTTLVVSICALILCGTTYVYPTYPGEFNEFTGLGQSNVFRVSVNFGYWFSIVAGIVSDAVGPRKAVTLSAGIIFGSYFIVSHISIANNHQFLSSICCFMIGNAIALAFIGVLQGNLRSLNRKVDAAKVTSLLSTSAGLSSVVLCIIHHLLFHKSESFFLLLTFGIPFTLLVLRMSLRTRKLEGGEEEEQVDRFAGASLSILIMLTLYSAFYSFLLIIGKADTTRYLYLAPFGLFIISIALLPLSQTLPCFYTSFDKQDYIRVIMVSAAPRDVRYRIAYHLTGVEQDIPMPVQLTFYAPYGQRRIGHLQELQQQHPHIKAHRAFDVKELLRKSEYWMAITASLLCMGSTLSLVNRIYEWSSVLHTVLQPFGKGRSELTITSYMASLAFFVANTGGRLVLGMISVSVDHHSPFSQLNEHKKRRPIVYFILVGCCLIFLGQAGSLVAHLLFLHHYKAVPAVLAVSSVKPGTTYIPYGLWSPIIVLLPFACLAGFGFGLIYTAMPILIVERFRVDKFGTILGSMVSPIAIGSIFFGVDSFLSPNGHSHGSFQFPLYLSAVASLLCVIANTYLFVFKVDPTSPRQHTHSNNTPRRRWGYRPAPDVNYESDGAEWEADDERCDWDACQWNDDPSEDRVSQEELEGEEEAAPLLNTRKEAF